MANPGRRLGHIVRHLSFVPNNSITPQVSRALTSLSGNSNSVSRKTSTVLESTISYVDTGLETDERAVIFLHGNPTSSYLWRNVIPHVEGLARCIAPDLLGMGKSGKEPNHSYTIADHYRYFSAWMEKMRLPEKLVFVVHDWGGGIGLHWCHQNRSRVQGIVYTETLLGTIPSWDYFPESARNIFQALRSEAGEQLVLEKNFFVERLLPGAILRELTPEEMNAYMEPFKEPGESRRPTLTFPREIPIDTDGPQYVVDLVKAYCQWLANDSTVPKLFIDADPGFFSPGIRRAVKDWPNQRVVVVKGSHFVQEDSPNEIGQSIADFVKEIYNI